MKSFLTITLILSLVRLQGQILIPGYDRLNHDINEIRMTKSDTCISIRLPYPHFNFYDSLPGIGQMIALETIYLIYPSKNKTLSKKYVQYLDSKNHNKLAVSKPVTMDEDSIFALLNKSMSQIELETIYPNIYEVKEPNSQTTNYDIVLSSHPAVYWIGVYTFKRNFFKSIDWLALREKISSTPNLNYKSNIETKLYSLYNLLLRYIDRTDKLYVFK